MSYAFFFSYARSDRDPYMKRFYEDLARLVRGKGGFAENEVSFFDGEDIEPGEKWEEKLALALRTSSTMLALFSPTYFKRPYCGKEWQVFTERIDAYTAEPPPGSSTPPPIIPVLWYPVDDATLPAGIGGFQRHHDDFGEVYKKDGVQYLLRKEVNGEYQEFLTRLADRIIARGREHPIPPLEALRPLARVQSAFHRAAAALAAVAPASETKGPRVAQFVFVAGSRQELKAVRRQLGFYGDEGGRDWKPYLPTLAEEIGIVTQNVAGIEQFHYEVLPAKPGLIDRLEDAKKKNKVVLLVVDVWTVRLPDYFQLMRGYDDRTLLNSAVLVVWNELDPELPAERDELQERLQVAFQARFASRDPQAFRDAITSPDELRRGLSAALHEMRSRIIKTADVVHKLQSDYPFKKPTLAGV